MGLHYCHTPTATKPITLHRDIKKGNGGPFPLNKIQRCVSNLDSFVVLAMADGNVKRADFALGKALGLETTMGRSAVGVERRNL